MIGSSLSLSFLLNTVLIYVQANCFIFQAEFFHNRLGRGLLFYLGKKVSCEENIIKLIRPVSEKKVKFVIVAMKRSRKQKSHKSTYQFQNQNPSAKLKQ